MAGMTIVAVLWFLFVLTIVGLNVSRAARRGRSRPGHSSWSTDNGSWTGSSDGGSSWGSSDCGSSWSSSDGGSSSSGSSGSDGGSSCF